MKNKFQLIIMLLMLLGGKALKGQSLANNFTSTQIDSIANDSLAYEGDIYYDNQNDTYYIGVSNGTLVVISTSTKSIVLNRAGGSIATANNTYIDMPLTSAHIQTINTKYYNVTGTASIRVLEDGVYMVSSSLSVTNLPSGNTKYILGMYINGTLRSYLTRGSVSLPSNDYWGASGVTAYTLNANDVISIRYVLNAGGSTLNTAFANISVSKL